MEAEEVMCEMLSCEHDMAITIMNSAVEIACIRPIEDPANQNPGLDGPVPPTH